MSPKNEVDDPNFQRVFLAKLLRVPAGCLEWTGTKDSLGYGEVRIAGAKRKAHRIAWHLANGPIPCGLIVMHKCDNPACCDPSHLLLGTRFDNNHDRHEKGRDGDHNGIQNGRAKLTEDQVCEIRALYQVGSSEFGGNALAVRFGVDCSTICRIVNRKRWVGAYKAPAISYEAELEVRAGTPLGLPDLTDLSEVQ
jgi:hypothetical protein